jgi:hypothetical protein
MLVYPDHSAHYLDESQPITPDNPDREFPFIYNEHAFSQRIGR